MNLHPRKEHIMKDLVFLLKLKTDAPTKLHLHEKTKTAQPMKIGPNKN